MLLLLCCLCCLWLLMQHCQLSDSLFEQCNHNVQLEAGQRIHINSPNYPREYPPGTSCRYTLQAPADYALKLQCDIQLNTSPSVSRCRHEVFHFNADGDELLSNTEYFCGSGNFERKSFLNRAVISYISMPLAQRKFATKLSGVVQKKLSKKKLHAEAQRQKQKQKVSSSLLAAGADNEQAAKPAKGATVATSTMSVIKDDIREAVAEQQKDDNDDDDDEDDDEDDDDDDDSTEDSKDDDDADDDDDDNDLTDDMLHALTHVNADNALAYVTSLLYNDEETDEDAAAAAAVAADLPKYNNGKPITNGRRWQKLAKSTWQANNSVPTTKISKTSVKRAKIVSGAAVAPGLDNNAHASSTGRFSCLVEATAPTCACGWSMSARIAGATAEAAINEFPSMAGVQYKRNAQVFCGATIIHQRYLLSAAHCFSTSESKNTSLIRIIVGELDLATVLETFYTRHYDIERIITHERFRAQGAHLDHDLALLRTLLPISWSRMVGPACLPFRSSVIAPLAGQRVHVAGWGTTAFGGVQSSRLLKTTLHVIDAQRCRQLLQTATPAHSFCTLTPGRDSCQYDSGGALYKRINGLLMAVGIVSYGYACASQQPAVNTRVASFVEWIASKTPDAIYCVK